MAPDTATGAPKPAAPSMNAPNEKAMNIAGRRSSVRLPPSHVISNLPRILEAVGMIDAGTITR
jgi:hypothetical protein